MPPQAMGEITSSTRGFGPRSLSLKYSTPNFLIGYSASRHKSAGLKATRWNDLFGGGFSISTILQDSKKRPNSHDNRQYNQDKNGSPVLLIQNQLMKSNTFQEVFDNIKVLFLASWLTRKSVGLTDYVLGQMA